MQETQQHKQVVLIPYCVQLQKTMVGWMMEGRRDFFFARVRGWSWVIYGH